MAKLETIKMENLGFELEKKDFNLSMTVDSTALYETNAVEYFRRAMIGENSSRSKFRQVLGVKDRTKLGNVVFESLIKAGDCDFDPSASTITQKTFEVTPIMLGTAFCVEDLEMSFVSDQIARGSSSFDDKFAFMTYFYETLTMQSQEELEIATWQADTDGFSPAIPYLEVFDGLEKLMLADATTLKPVSATAVTAANVIAKIVEGRNALPTAVKNKADFVYILSSNVYEAYVDSISANMQSGAYYASDVPVKFQGREVFEAKGMSDDVIVITYWSNLLNIQDLLTDETGWNVVDFMKTNLNRRIGVRADAKFQPAYVLGNEVYIHKPA